MDRVATEDSKLTDQGEAIEKQGERLLNSRI